MPGFNRTFKIFLTAVGALIIGFGCAKSRLSGPKEILNNGPKNDAKKPDGKTPVVESLKMAIQKDKLLKYPELTLMIMVKDVEGAVEKIEKNGGRIDYNPNKFGGNAIEFLIVTLPAEKVVDDKFIASLKLTAASPAMHSQSIRPQSLTESNFDKPIHVPTKDVNLPALQAAFPDKVLGENVVVAVIDSGIDASHPVFQDRVVYWNDHTQEGRMKVENAPVKDGKITLNGKEVELPSDLDAEKPVFTGYINEAAMKTQLSDGEKTGGAKGIDVNLNSKQNDKFLFVIGNLKEVDKTVVVVDTNLNGNLDETGRIGDFNENRESPSKEVATFLQFKSSKTIQYPLLIQKAEDGTVTSLTVGWDSGGHGTHVSGIIAGNGKNIKGAAPGAKLMGLKVCSAITCTSQAIFRAFIDAFYNSKGIVPDIVNISLGSHESYVQDMFNYLMRDLSAKFGTLFFISASNSGPGYRSINSIGSFGPTVQVGAHVSKDTLLEHYTVGKHEDLLPQGLLYFTSLGPSYTGQLRPNIVAPGSAISSIPINEGLSAMFNGTSMSSPLAAGTGAAILSVAKSQEALNPLMKLKKEKIESLQKGENKPYSLTDLAMSLRISLESTAKDLPFTRAQQGFGLIDAKAAYDNLVAYWTRAKDQLHTFVDFKINENQKSQRLYTRDSKIQNARQITLSLENDGELPEEAVLNLQNEKLVVKLVEVKTQAPNGDVIDVTSEQPIFIEVTGDFKSKGTQAELVLANSRRSQFVSVRDVKNMKEGYTYLAQYDVMRGNQRVFSFLDVVHKGIEVPKATKNEKKFEKRFITANGFHRYPIATSEIDGFIEGELTLSAGEEGRLFFMIYDTDGKQVDFQVVDVRPTAENQITKANIRIPNKKAGLYEFAIAASSSFLMKSTKYDLTLKTKSLKVSLADSKSKPDQKVQVKIASNSSQTLFVSDPNDEVKTINAKIEGTVAMTLLDNVKVLPNRWTFRRIDLPEVIQPTQLDKEQDLTIQLASGKWKESFFGRIDHQIYTYDKATKEFKAIAKASTTGSSESKKLFKNVSVENPIYLAIETFLSTPEEGGLKSTLKEIPVEILFPSTKKLVVQSLESPDVSSSSSVTSVKLKSDESEINSIFIKEKDSKARVRSNLKISTDIKGLEFDIPITVNH